MARAVKKQHSDGTEPIYKSVVANLLKQIDTETVKSGDPLPSEKELSQQHQVSRTTIRRAMAELVKLGKLVTVAGKGTFVAQKKKFMVSTERLRRKIIAYIVPSINDPCVAGIHDGIVSKANAMGYGVAIYSSNMRHDIEEMNIQMLLERSEAGAIIFPPLGRGAAKTILSLKEYGYPFVLVDRFFEEVPSDFVGTDNFQGAFDAVRYLASLGHRRIGHIRGISCSGNDERYKGYLQALEVDGIEFDSELVVEQEIPEVGSDPVAGGRNEMRQLMSLTNPPTAVFAANDPLALGASWTAREMGLRVGENVAIVGFDGLGMAALNHVPLTTVRQPVKEIGQTAVELLIENVKAVAVGRKNRLQQIKLMPELVLRDSVCRPSPSQFVVALESPVAKSRKSLVKQT